MNNPSVIGHPSSGLNVFKFGGASVRDAEAVRNVAAILKMFAGEKIVVVISAMGKITNALEELHAARFHKEDYKPFIKKIRDFHIAIGNDLFGEESDDMNAVYDLFEELEMKVMEPCSSDFDMEYDQVVSFGELISTAMVQAFLAKNNFSSAWTDARMIIKTDNRYRDARVDWNRSALGAEQVKLLLENKDIVIIQGFIGSTSVGNTTTLGREGSDFTAAAMAHLLDAGSVTIWKDVPGMLNADPKWFSDTVKLDKISFREAIELAYYGASVIHPKTIKPIQNKNIPLHIKSFIHPDEEGSVIQENMDYDHLVPSYIFTDKQVLISITPRDFSFVAEDNLRDIFDVLASLGIRVRLMENSAISLSLVTDKDDYKLEKLFAELHHNYQVKYNENLVLLTVRHYNDETLRKLTAGKEILLEQRSRQTVRMVVKGEFKKVIA
ncbi:MAG: aspartate kinase [Flavobacteriales bacterium]|nr:aspartate kinase [Flavobacteriales bacterium]